ncbi:MAG TPA: T9SS type A sorting domain-containing protein, partial [Saprospiraceae bacterium]|nr:T9SS type A sorting domain-containing protein [Saprospiraceae bacterium]
IKIGPLKGDCTTNYSFAVIDCKNERCGREFNIGKVCCEAQGNCEIGEIKWERSDCKEGQFYLFFKFPYANTSECFRLKGNGHDYGTFPYTPQPIKIGPFKGDCATNYSFAFIDCKNERCAREVNVGKVCCETQGNCEIGEIKYEKTQCKEGEFYISFNFAHHNNSECFTLKGNGKDYGKFNYDSLPIKIGPLKGDCVTKYEFIFRDCANEKCARELNLGTVCCEQKGESCEIFNLEVTPLECTGTNQYSVRINFGHKGTKGVGFDVFDRKGSIGFYAYSDLPIVIENFKKSGLSYDFIKICENDNEKCCKAAEFEPLNCFGIGKGFFTLEDLQVYGSTSGLVVESIFPFPSGFELEVFDLGGRTLSTQIIEKTSNRMLVRIHQYLPGMYVLKTRYSYDTRPFKFLR